MAAATSAGVPWALWITYWKTPASGDAGAAPAAAATASTTARTIPIRSGLWFMSLS